MYFFDNAYCIKMVKNKKKSIKKFEKYSTNGLVVCMTLRKK